MISQLPIRMTDVEASLPPCNISAEMSVLAGILTDPSALDRVSDKLTSQSFYHSAHQEIFGAAASIASKGQVVDLISLTSHLEARGKLERVGGKTALVNLMADPIAGINCDLHAEIVAEKATRRELIATAKLIIAAANDQSKDLPEILDHAESSIYELANRAGKGVEVEHISEACIRVVDANEKGESPGMKTKSFLDLDGMTGGWRPGQLVTVAAATAMGKSHFMVAQALEAALEGYPVVLFSCEMTSDELAERLMARMGQLDSGLISRREVRSEIDCDRLIRGCTKISGLPIYVFDSPNPSLNDMKAALRRVAAEEGKPVRMAILDYLQLLGDGSGNRVREIDLITRGCKCMAKDFGLTFMALAQINRGVESRQNKRPGLADLRESGSIEQHSNTVVFLYRDEYYDSESPDKGIIELIVAKNRGGETGSAKMLFKPETSWFGSIS